MPMDKRILKESDRLHADAERLLKKHRVQETLGKFGRVLPTGSFAANLMTVGDIDLYVIGRWTKPSVRRIFDVLLDRLDAKGWQMLNWVKYRDPRFPRAWYIGIKDFYRGRPWKIDVWFLTERQVKALPFARWDNRPVTAAQRSLIIECKRYRDAQKLAIPSYRIYEAILREGRRPRREVINYCRRGSRR